MYFDTTKEETFENDGDKTKTLKLPKSITGDASLDIALFTMLVSQLQKQAIERKSGRLNEKLSDEAISYAVEQTVIVMSGVMGESPLAELVTADNVRAFVEDAWEKTVEISEALQAKAQEGKVFFPLSGD